VSVAAREILLEDASRSFSVRADRGTSLKELVLRRQGGGAPPVQALDGVSLRVAPGETVGIVGRNGAGKSSTLRVLAGIVPLQAGRVEVGGRIVSLLELGAGFGREFSGRENVELNGALHGLGRDEVAARMDGVLAFSELGEFVDAPVKTYSAGMLVRLGFSIAAHLNADVLLIDEVLAVGDEGFQRKCLRRISERIAAGATLVLVSHDPGAIERVCERVVVLDSGRKVFRAGEALRIAPRLGDPAPARLELEVRDESGRAVFRTATEPVADELEFAVERLALLGGDYDLVAGDRVVRFSVADEPGGEGVVDLRGTWRVAGRESAVPGPAAGGAR
jgi:ABC-type polysaccharide/polyol phosphate transport system ATPase subunit